MCNYCQYVMIFFIFILPVFCNDRYHPHLKSEKPKSTAWDPAEETGEYWNTVGRDQINRAKSKRHIEGKANNVILFIGDGMGIQVDVGNYDAIGCRLKHIDNIYSMIYTHKGYYCKLPPFLKSIPTAYFFPIEIPTFADASGLKLTDNDGGERRLETLNHPSSSRGSPPSLSVNLILSVDSIYFRRFQNKTLLNYIQNSSYRQCTK